MTNRLRRVVFQLFSRDYLPGNSRQIHNYEACFAPTRDDIDANIFQGSPTNECAKFQSPAPRRREPNKITLSDRAERRLKNTEPGVQRSSFSNQRNIGPYEGGRSRGKIKKPETNRFFIPRVSYRNIFHFPLLRSAPLFIRFGFKDPILRGEQARSETNIRRGSAKGRNGSGPLFN